MLDAIFYILIGFELNIVYRQFMQASWGKKNIKIVSEAMKNERKLGYDKGFQRGSQVHRMNKLVENDLTKGV